MRQGQQTSSAWLQGTGGLLVRAIAGQGDLPWNSAVTRLITGISAEFGEERYRLLRKKIYTTGPVSDWDRNLVKVCAKRINKTPASQPSGFREIDVGCDLVPDPSSDRTRAWPGSPLQPRDIAAWLNVLVTREIKTSGALPRHQSPRPVAAALVDGQGNLLAANVNSNNFLQARHAEVNLLLALASGGVSKIPMGSTLYVSLKPCRMCASLINTLTPSPEPLRIVALKDDPGPHGRHAILQGLEILSE